MSLPVPSSPDISAIITSLGVFSLAVAAVVGGIYKGIKEIKKNGSDSGAGAKPSTTVEPTAIRELSEASRLLLETNQDMRHILRDLVRKADDLVEALKDHREMTRSQIEEQHRLRAATADLVQIMRRIT